MKQEDATASNTSWNWAAVYSRPLGPAHIRYMSVSVGAVKSTWWLSEFVFVDHECEKAVDVEMIRWLMLGSPAL